METTKACTRCGNKHTDAEKVAGKRLSCTETKEFWADISRRHLELYGHRAHATTNEAGEWICWECKRRLC